MTSREVSLSPYVGLFAAQVFFGSLPVIAKFVLVAIPAVSLVGFRVAITAATLTLIQLARGRFWLKESADYWKLGVLSLFGVVFNQLLFLTGLSLTKASNTSLLAVTIPIFALTVGSIAGFEKLGRLKLVGIALAGIGVVLLIDPRNASFSSDTTLGDLLIILNSLSYGIYVATSKTVIMRNGVFRSMTWVFIFASIFCIPLGVYSLWSVDIASVQPATWWIIVYIAVGATAAPYLLNAFALKHVDPSTVAVFVYLQPLIGFSLAVIFLSESIGVVFGLAALLIFVGVFLVTRRKYVPSET